MLIQGQVHAFSSPSGEIARKRLNDVKSGLRNSALGNKYDQFEAVFWHGSVDRSVHSGELRFASISISSRSGFLREDKDICGRSV